MNNLVKKIYKSLIYKLLKLLTPVSNFRFSVYLFSSYFCKKMKKFLPLAVIIIITSCSENLNYEHKYLAISSDPNIIDYYFPPVDTFEKIITIKEPDDSCICIYAKYLSKDSLEIFEFNICKPSREDLSFETDYLKKIMIKSYPNLKFKKYLNYDFYSYDEFYYYLGWINSQGYLFFGKIFKEEKKFLDNIVLFKKI